MKLARGICVTSTLLLLLQYPLVFGQPSPQKLFLLEDAAGNQWCSFTAESAWKSQVDNTEPQRVAILTYSDHSLAQIDFTQWDEARDYLVDDNYSVDAAGSVVKLSRRINALPGNRSIVQMFSIHSGKAIKTSESSTVLTKGEPSSPVNALQLPILPVNTVTKMFPFSALLEKPDLRTNAKICVQKP